MSSGWLRRWSATCQNTGKLAFRNYHDDASSCWLRDTRNNYFTAAQLHPLIPVSWAFSFIGVLGLIMSEVKTNQGLVNVGESVALVVPSSPNCCPPDCEVYSGFMTGANIGTDPAVKTNSGCRLFTLKVTSSTMSSLQPPTPSTPPTPPYQSSASCPQYATALTLRQCVNVRVAIGLDTHEPPCPGCLVMEIRPSITLLLKLDNSSFERQILFSCRWSKQYYVHLGAGQ